MIAAWISSPGESWYVVPPASAAGVHRAKVLNRRAKNKYLVLETGDT